MEFLLKKTQISLLAHCDVICLYFNFSGKEGHQGVQNILDELNQNGYFLYKDDKAICIIFSEHHTPKAVLKAFCHAFHSSMNINEPFDFEELDEEMQKAGWVTNYFQLSTNGWKVKLKN